jgi:hypothetical protein
MLSSKAPIALSHWDGAPGAGAEDCMKSARRIWRVELGSRPRRDWWGGKRVAGGMSEDNDRCFSTLVLGAFSTGVFQHHCITPH